MPYRIELSKSAAKQLDKLPDSVLTILIQAIQMLSEEPRPNNCKKLKGRDAYRIRKGNYRIIYEIFDDVLLIDVVAIGHRKDVYE
jgi:mRNA interferase RelE/StbE